jgi:hypothetical protein
MSIFNIKGKSVDPAALQTRLADAIRRIRELESQYATVSLEWAAGGPAEAAKRDRLEADVTAAKRDRDALSAALALAREAEAIRDRENAAAIRATQVRAVVQQLRARTRAAVELSAAIEQAADAFRRMISASEKARAACPIGTAWPMGGLVEFHELRKLVEIELYRHGGDPSLSHARSFPGGHPRDLSKISDLASLKPLAEELQAADDFVINTLKNFVIGKNRPAPAAPAPVPEAQRVEQPAFIEPPLVDESALQPFTGNALAPLPVTKLSVTE